MSSVRSEALKATRELGDQELEERVLRTHDEDELLALAYQAEALLDAKAQRDTGQPEDESFATPDQVATQTERTPRG